MATITTAQPMQTTQVFQVPAVVPPPPADHPAKKFAKVFTGLGIALLASGVLSIILGGVALSPQFYGYAGSGIWCGVWIIASGALAVSTGCKANSCNVIAGLVVSITTAIVTFCVGASEAVLAGFCYSPWNCSESYKGIHATLSAISFMACILAIIHSSYCCCGTCGHSKYQGRVLTATTMTTVPNFQDPMQHAYAAQPGVVVQQQYGQMQQGQTQYSNFQQTQAQYNLPSYTQQGDPNQFQKQFL